MMDRNLRGERGGDYVPFLGLAARTTPLAGRLAQAFDVPLVTVVMLPAGPRRWRLAFSEPLMPPASGDEKADLRTALERANARLGEAILRHPETYLWTLKRWKSRPSPEQGRYPAYSYHDPE
jgi:lauroyl/myristoyl acyltransferase